jgi:tetracycline 7-halogenase / FADH2 O2-dependent halogenase
MKADFDIAIVGSGFAGSLLAMIARRLGRSVVLVERGRHPRFAIGESSTPLANLLLEELAARHALPSLLPLAKWGSWQRTRPEIACGLKRGFSFYHHRAGQPFSDDDRHANQLLVAASPCDAIADTHWYRAGFDHFLVREAQALGVTFLDETKLESAEFTATGARLHGRRHAETVDLRARFVIDASGPRGFLHHALRLPEAPLPGMPATQGLYTHFAGVARWDALHPEPVSPPYPVDDAAVHHVFDGGWIWVLRFNNGFTSAGAAVTDALAHELKLAEGEPAWQRLLARFPSLAAQFAGARPVRPLVHAPRLPFLTGQMTGPGWLLLPSAAGVVDPLLSTGIPLTLLGITRLARILASDWEGGLAPEALRTYEAHTLAELQDTARLVGALYAGMGDFALFKRLSLLYFAAVSFTETARRLGKPERAPGFLLGRHPGFAPAARRCVERALQPLDDTSRAALLADIDRTIAPVDVAGLSDRTRRDWHPATAADLFANAHKLGASGEEVRAMLKRTGFFDSSNPGASAPQPS